MTSASSRQLLEEDVNRVATAIKVLREGAADNRDVITAENAEKISNYLRILVDTLAEDLKRLSRVPPAGKFTLDADIPAVTPPIPSKPVYRAPEPEGRLVGQRKAAAAQDDDGVGFIQE